MHQEERLGLPDCVTHLQLVHQLLHRTLALANRDIKSVHLAGGAIGARELVNQHVQGGPALPNPGIPCRDRASAMVPAHRIAVAGRGSCERARQTPKIGGVAAWSIRGATRL